MTLSMPISSLLTLIFLLVSSVNSSIPASHFLSLGFSVDDSNLLAKYFVDANLSDQDGLPPEIRMNGVGFKVGDKMVVVNKLLSSQKDAWLKEVAEVPHQITFLREFDYITIPKTNCFESIEMIVNYLTSPDNKDQNKLMLSEAAKIPEALAITQLGSYSRKILSDKDQIKEFLPNLLHSNDQKLIKAFINHRKDVLKPDYVKLVLTSLLKIRFDIGFKDKLMKKLGWLEPHALDRNPMNLSEGCERLTSDLSMSLYWHKRNGETKLRFLSYKVAYLKIFQDKLANQKLSRIEKLLDVI
jgi:hypothetical protein